MKKFYYLLLLTFLVSCSEDLDSITDSSRLRLRTLPNHYTIPYQYLSGDIETEVSNDLDTWNTDDTASPNTSLYGTSSAIYENTSRIMTVYQGTNGALRCVEYVDLFETWTVQAAISTASSPLLPSVIHKDGTLYVVHANGSSGSNQIVRGNDKTGYAGSWSSTYDVKFGTGAGQNIVTNYSPSLEYHTNAEGVEFLITAKIILGVGVPAVYWRYTDANYTVTTAPAISLGAGSTTELNASICPIAVEDDLYLFYTSPGISNSSEQLIRFVKATVTGSTSGAISSSWSASATVPGAYTNHKIDGFYEPSTEKIVLVFQNASTGEIDLAISDDFGANWDLSVTGIAPTTGAPSIANF
jgi:hypothetical protein